MSRRISHNVVWGLVLALDWSIAPATLHSQTDHIQFENLSVEHGLSHPNVRAIVQDPYGFMWFGTEDGLNRYDGYSFTVYKHDPTDSTSLSSNSILSLLLDEDSVLWIGTNGGGLNAFDLKTGIFKRFNLAQQKYVWSLCKGRDGILWIAGDNLIGMQRATGKELRPDSASAASGAIKVIRAIHEDNNGTLWMGTWFDGVNKLERDRLRVVAYRNDPTNPASLSENHVISVFQDSHGYLWFGTNTGGVNRFDPREEKFTRYPKKKNGANALSDNTVRAMFEDPEGRLWIATSGGGVNIMDQQTGRMMYLMHSSAKPSSLSGDHVFVIYKDNAGMLWLGTDGGISKYCPVKKKFAFLQAGMETHSFPTPLGAISQDRFGDVWIVNYGKGITRLSQDLQSFRYYSHDRWTSHSRYGRFVMTIYGDRLGFIWFGTYGNGLARFDRRTNSFKTFRVESSDSSAGGNSASAIHEDAHGTLWIGTGRGIASLDRTSNRFTYYGDYASIPRRDPDVFNVESILAEEGGVLWLGTQYAGLIEFDPQRGVLSRAQHDNLDSNSISSNDVRVIHKDRQGRLWVGTYGGGVDLFDRRTRTFQHLTEREGMLSNIISGILEDDAGNLWISSPRGLSRFTPDTREIRNYEAADGIAGLAENSFARRSSGEMIFGSASGLYFFHPKNLKDNPHAPNVILTSFSVLNELFPLPRPIHTAREIVLDYTQNFITFEFAALDFVAPERNQYAYMLEGIEEDWVYGRSRRRANYTHLDPGRYVFRVKGSNNDGVWNEQGASVTIIITAPFWQRWWFRLLAVLVFGVLVGLGYNYRVNKLLEVERVRVRVARDLHDELGSNLSGIALASRLVQEGENLTDEQRRRLSEISDNATQTADALREIVWFINPEHDQPENLVLKMKDVASVMLNDAEVAFESNDDVFDNSTDIEQRRHIFLIYREILNNVVKHAHSSRVDVHMRRDGNRFRMIVVDNGVGFDPRCACSGNGLKNLQARAEEIGGALSIVSSPGRGTQISLEVRMT